MAHGFASTIRAMERAARAAARERERELREAVKLAHLKEKAAKQFYVVSKTSEAQEKNETTNEILENLESLLSQGIQRNPKVSFKSLYHQVDINDVPKELTLGQPPNTDQFYPKKPGFMAKLIPGAKRRYGEKVAAADIRYRTALDEFDQLKTRRQAVIVALEMSADAHNREVDAFKVGLSLGDPDAIKAYAGLVLDHSPYPEDFPQEARIAYVQESKQLIVDFRAPTIVDAVPLFHKFKYIKTQDTITSTRVPEKERQAIYSRVVAQITLRTLYELFESLPEDHVETIVFNLYVLTIDPGTGQEIQPYIVSARVARSEFVGLELSAVEPLACLKRLKSSVSRSPAELLPVKPIFDINMADRRFVQEQDVLSTLDSRPNLMALTPGEFESLITNLFQKMGLETKLTQASRDGGVDCIAFDQRPILGGKVVIQAKRYKHTVGVSAVRDLFGTMHNEGASKGILVTTSGYGKAAYTFANEKPIELVTGSNLLFLLQEHTGVEAKIEPPDDWVDPVLDKEE